MDKVKKSKAGHAEIHGETLAKFEFFENGFNPYSRYLDVDKVDLILRKRDDKKIAYHEVQVKYGRLYHCTPKWEQNFFDYTSWRFFRPNEFSECPDTLSIAYILVHPDEGYKGDIFIFPVRVFETLLRSAILNQSKKGGSKHNVLFSRSRYDKDKWYLRRKSKFDSLDKDSVIDVSGYRRNFNQVGATLGADGKIQI